MMVHSLMQLAHVDAPPAKGAPLGDLIWATVVATALSGAVLWIARAHRSGRISWLGHVAAFAERESGLPAWAALPAALVGISLLVAVFGFYWDVAKHIDTGRDPSPFGTPAHYPILIGLAGITLGGFLAIVLGTEDSVPTSVRITDGWRAPLGGLLIFLCGGFALIGFPLDDVCHTLFGQDVTLWGPTHVLMVGGASLSTLGLWVLLVEANRATAGGPRHAGWRGVALRLREPMVAGAFLIGVSTLQLEFDYGVPQFQLVYQPILIMLAAGCALVAARIRVGRGGALFAALFFCVLNAILSGAVHGPLEQAAVLHFPLYLAEAAIVELVGLRIGADRPLALGLTAGALIGTAGLAAEWGWSHVWMPLPWPSSLLPEAATLGFVAALAGGTLGGLIGRSLNGQPGGQAPVTRWALVMAASAAIFCIGFPLPMTAGPRTTATAHLRTVHPAPNRTVQATVRLHPANAAANSQWLTVLAWQGGGLVDDRLEQVGPGTFRTTRPIPVYGEWKAILRMEHGRALQALPVYLPNDPAIPAKGAPAKRAFTRTFVRDKQILQREYQGGPLWIELPAYLLLLGIAAGWMVALGLGLRRVGSTTPPSAPPRVRRLPATGLVASRGTA
jgi:hypothetical protein